MRCGICFQQMAPGERLHSHIPDFYLSVWNCQGRLMRHREFEHEGGRDEPLPLELPETWITFILWSCGGHISQSGLYRLPGCIWEWVVLKLSGDEEGASWLERRIEEIISRLEGGGR